MQQTLEATRKQVQASQNQVRTYEQVYDKIVWSGDAGVAYAKNRLEAERNGLNAQEAMLVKETATHDRVKELHETGNVRDETLIEAQQKLIEAKPIFSAVMAEIQSVENDVVEKQNAGDAKRLQAQADVDEAKALVAKAEVETTMAKGELAKAQSNLARSQQELTDFETRLATQESHQILAPFNGVVTQLTGPERLVKEGHPICTLTPF